MIRFAGKTDPGHRGGTNEDAMGWDADHNLWFIADGVGGRAAGQMASGLVKESLLRRSPHTSLREAIHGAHTAIVERVCREPDYAGMASTVVCAQIHGGTCDVAWVGDSRAYLYRERTLRQLTRDHTFSQQLRKEHELTTQEILQDPNRDKLTHSLGGRVPEPSLMAVPLQRGDRILLCSDGLTNELNDSAITEILRINPTAEAAVPELVGRALENGGHDNVTAIVIDYRCTSRVARLRLPVRVALIGLILVTLSAGGVALWYFFKRH
jgi:PPM family protein phosphatase